MEELENRDVYACALAMPTPENPYPTEWTEEMDRQVKRGANDEIYLVGHSLGVPAILRYVETLPEDNPVNGLVLVSGPVEPVSNERVNRFLDHPFDFPLIKSRVGNIAVIHGEDDPRVPLSHANLLKDSLGADLTLIPGGGHLNGSSGWRKLPQCLEVLVKMMDVN